MEDNILHLNEMPSKTWYWLKVNGCDIKLPNSNGNSVIKTDKPIKNEEIINGIEEVQCSLGKDFDKYMVGSGQNNFVFEHDDTLFIYLSFDDDKISKDALNIKVCDNANVSIYMVYSTKPEFSGTASIQTKAIVGNNSSLKLYQTSLISQNYNILNDIGIVCNDNSRFENVKIMLGSQRTYSGLYVNLIGEKSSCKNDLAYYGINDKIYDFNYVVNHIGKNTNSEIYVNGILDDQSKKTFRGTIDFKCGSSGSIGNEKEDVLMLGDDVSNKTVPIILCTEEDVKGNHGASIGRIEDENLFYLMSRGLNEEEIKHILSYSKIMSKAKLFNEQKIENMVSDFVLEEMNG